MHDERSTCSGEGRGAPSMSGSAISTHRAPVPVKTPARPARVALADVDPDLLVGHPRLRPGGAGRLARPAMSASRWGGWWPEGAPDQGPGAGAAAGPPPDCWRATCASPTGWPRSPRPRRHRRPAGRRPRGRGLSRAVDWRVHEQVSAAVLDERFAAAACRWPKPVGGRAPSHGRHGRPPRRPHGHLPARVRRPARPRRALGELADRFGRVTPGRRRRRRAPQPSAARPARGRAAPDRDPVDRQADRRPARCRAATTASGCCRPRRPRSWRPKRRSRPAAPGRATAASTCSMTMIAAPITPASPPSRRGPSSAAAWRAAASAGR